MTTIENLLNEFLTNYRLGKKEEYTKVANILLNNIQRDEKQFSYTKHSYMAATALYYLFIQHEKPLSYEQSAEVTKLIYVCLINNFLDNKDVDSSDPKYLDLIGGSQLAIIVLLQNSDFFMSELITTVGYMPNYAQMIMKSQLLLFGGIVKDANERHIHHRIDDQLYELYEVFHEQMYQRLPTGVDLRNLKNESATVLENIRSYIRMSFKEPDDDEMFACVQDFNNDPDFDLF